MTNSYAIVLVSFMLLRKYPDKEQFQKERVYLDYNPKISPSRVKAVTGGR